MLSEDSDLALTGESADVCPGTYLFITNEDETNFYANESAKDLTNMVICIMTCFPTTSDIMSLTL